MIQPPLGPQIEHLLRQVEQLRGMHPGSRRAPGLQILRDVANLNLRLERRPESDRSIPGPGVPAAGAVFFTSPEGRRRYAEQLRIRCTILTIHLPEHSFTGSFQLAELLGPVDHMSAPIEQLRALETLARDLSTGHARLGPEPGPETEELEMFRRLISVTWREVVRSRLLARDESGGEQDAS